MLTQVIVFLDGKQITVAIGTPQGEFFFEGHLCPLPYVLNIVSQWGCQYDIRVVKSEGAEEPEIQFKNIPVRHVLIS